MDTSTAQGCLALAIEWEETAAKMLSSNPEKILALQLSEKWLARAQTLENSVTSVKE